MSLASKQYARHGSGSRSTAGDRDVAGDGGLFRVLAVLIWAACVLPTAILMVRAGRVWGETASYDSLTQWLRNVSIGFVVIWAIRIIISRGAELGRRPFGVVLLTFFALFWPVLTNYLHGGPVAGNLSAALVSLTVALAVFSLRLSVHHLGIIGMLGGLTGLVSLVMAVLWPMSAYSVEPAGRVLAGPFSNNNYLGITLVLCLPFALLIRKRLYMLSSMVIMIIPILMGGSRTAVAVLLIVAAVGGLTSLTSRPNVRRVIVGASCGMALVVSGALPYLALDEDAFTSRGTIWSLAREQFGDFVFLGAGEGWFEANSFSAGFSLNHAHNMLLHPLIVGGLAGLAVVAGLLVMILVFGLRVARADGGVSPGLFALGLFVAGALGNFFILDMRDLRFFASGLVIMALLSMSTLRSVSISDARSGGAVVGSR